MLCKQAVPPGVLHKASGPDGPWTAVPLPFGCNNPAPGVATNGSYVVVVCTWSAHKVCVHLCIHSCTRVVLSVHSLMWYSVQSDTGFFSLA
jgi:hypothetical protein